MTMSEVVSQRASWNWSGNATYSTFAALIALLIFNFLFTPNFASLQTLNVNLTQVAPIVIVAIGMTLVIATGGIDLSVGSLMAIAGALAPMIFLEKLFPIANVYLAAALAICLSVAAASLFGAFNGWLIGRFTIQPIVATLVLFIAGRGIAQVVTNGNLQAFKFPEFQLIGLGRVLVLQAILVRPKAQRGGGNPHHALFGRHHDAGLRGHAGLEQFLRVGNVHDDGVSHYALRIGRVKTELANLAFKLTFGIGIDGKAHSLSMLDQADVGLADTGLNHHFAQVLGRDRRGLGDMK